MCGLSVFEDCLSQSTVLFAFRAHYRTGCSADRLPELAVVSLIVQHGCITLKAQYTYIGQFITSDRVGIVPTLLPGDA